MIGALVQFAQRSVQFLAHADAFFRCHVTGIGAGVGETLAAIGAAERLLTRMYAHVLLQMMLELKCFVAIGAFEFAQQRRFIVTDHVSLEAVHVGKCLLANFTALQIE